MDLTLISRNDNNYVTLKGVYAEQFGKNVISIQCTVNEVLKFLEIDNEVQRQLDEHKVAGIKKYIQYGLEGNDIYFSPLIFSSRNLGEYDHNKSELKLKFGDKLVILDGQHRIKAFEVLKRQVETQNNVELLEKINNFPLTIQVFKKLTKNEERQLFTDINSNSSPVNNTLLIMYKENDLYGQIVKEIVYNHPSISEDLFELRLKATRSKLMTATTLYLIALAINDGGVNQNAKKTININNYHLYKKKTEKFLTLLRKHTPQGALDRDKYVIYYPNVLVGIAKFINTMSKEYPNEKMEKIFKDVISKVNWSHKNKEFDKIATNYNPQTKRYRFNARGTSTSEMIKFLMDKYYKERSE